VAAAGSTCQNNSDCISTSCNSTKICDQSALSADCITDTDCKVGYCNYFSPNVPLNTCTVYAGDTCQNNTDCSSGSCNVNKTCDPGSDRSQCSQNSDCINLNCVTTSNYLPYLCGYEHS
jgi:hypothetical protein